MRTRSAAAFTAQVVLGSTYAYDNEGKMTSVTYPSVSNHSAKYTTSFDPMARPSAMVDQGNNTVVNGLSYGPANEMTGISYFGYAETRSYNSRLQLTSINALQYLYPASPKNNGKANEQKVTGGEDVVYQYDALNRLIQAQTASGSSTTWGQNFGYDGFGNLTAKAGTGTAPSQTMAVDATTNRLSGYGYDANGNVLSSGTATLAYDVENRVASVNGGTTGYGYDSGNRRVWKGTYNSSGVMTAQEAYLYSASGQKLGTYSLVLSNPPPYSNYATATDVQVFFGGKRVGHASGSPTLSAVGATSQDRVGSFGSYYPYGEDKGTPVANDQMKFATYTRDSATGLDYAMNRYYSSAWGRFGSADLHPASNAGNLPGNWNRYTYVGGDPINKTDPLGLCSPEDDPPCYSEDSQPGCADGACDDLGGGNEGGGGGGGGHNRPLLPGPDDQAGPGNGSGPPVSDDVLRARWFQGLEKAIKALQNALCASLFGLTGQTGSIPNPSPGPNTVLSFISNSYQFGPIQSQIGTITTATTVPTGPSSSISIGDGAFVKVWSSVQITVNDVAGSFVTGGVDDWAWTCPQN